MPRLVETTSLFVLIALAALRPLVAESYDSSTSGITAALSTIGDPSPLSTLVFDLLILLSAGGWLMARTKVPIRRYRRTGLEWGVGIVAVAAVVSCTVASNKRLAINATIDWLCYPIFAIVLVQLMHRRWHRQLLLTVVLASACAQSVKCLDDYLWYEDTWATYQKTKDELWKQQGVELDSAQVELFERRVQAREAQGFFPHSNVAGSYFVLCCLAAVATLLTCWKTAHHATSRLRSMGAAMSTLLILIAAILTKSRGALAAGAIGIVLGVGIACLRRWIDVHRRKVIILAWLGTLLGGAAIVGYGLYHDSLPGTSLTFRWQYWRTSIPLITDHALTGVGRDNFGRHYLRYKPIEALEEVSNPHNLLVQAGAEWGVIGLAGVVAMLVGGSLVVTAPCRPSNAIPQWGSDFPARKTIVGWGVALGIAIFLGRLPLLGTSDVNYLYYTTAILGIAWCFGFWSFTPLVHGETQQWIGTGVAIGLFTFLVHEMINFAMFVPGSSMTFFAMLAYAVAERSPVEVEETTHQSAWKVSVAVLWIAALLSVIIVAVIPVSRAAYYLHQANKVQHVARVETVNPDDVDQQFRSAMAADPFDPTPCVERARWWFSAASIGSPWRDRAFAKAVESTALAMERDPFSIAVARTRVQIFQAKAEYSGREEDYLAAIAAAERVVALYPADPNGLVTLADCQRAAGEAMNHRILIQNAIEHYRRALKLEDARPAWETIRRLRDRERDEIHGKIRAAEDLLQSGT